MTLYRTVLLRIRSHRMRLHKKSGIERKTRLLFNIPLILQSPKESKNTLRLEKSYEYWKAL